jgi:hypothetical protein
MKTLLLCLALLVGLSDGTIAVFGGFPFIFVSPTEIIVEGVAFPIETVKAMRFVPDSAVM